MVKTRNILLVGKTGGGKSTLANVITGTNKFKEIEGFTSGTDFFQQEFLELKGVKYRIVDTVGLDDNSGLSEQEVLCRIAQGVCLMEEGLTQAFFVINERFDARELVIFEKIKKVIFDNEVVKHTTIVKTKFPKFDDDEECEKQKKELRDRKDAIGEIARSCNDIIFVDNAPVVEIKEEFDERKKKKKLREQETNQEKREDSRELLLKYLEDECQSFYCPGYWERIKVNTYGYISDKIKAEERLKVKNLTPETKKLIEKERKNAEKKVAEEFKKELTQVNVVVSESSGCC